MTDASGATILVVEDEISILDMITDGLEDEGFTVLSSTTAEGGLDLFRQHPEIDLLFTDIRLPGGMNGWDLAESVRRTRPELPVVYATGYTEGPNRIVSGGKFFAKPYRILSVVDAMSDLLCHSQTKSKTRDHHLTESPETQCAPSPSASYSVPA